MSERSIAEIIGWRWHDRGRMWVPPDGDKGLDSYTRPVNVDDMLAWLNSKVDSIDVNYKRTTREWFVWVEIASGDGYHEPRDVFLDDEYCGSTLYAACEEAVRAVAPFVCDGI